ncbi:MAG: hypothetical protein LBM70_04815 [Victivallales bacterium]|nr:hypothetical protein [Victivallales bacterium]
MTNTVQIQLNSANRALRFLFAAPDADGKLTYAPDSLPEFLDAILTDTIHNQENSVVFANLLFRKFGDVPLRSRLTALFFNFLVENRILPEELEKSPRSESCRFVLYSARDLWKGINTATRILSRKTELIFPATLDYLKALPTPPGSLDEQFKALSASILEADPFRTSRTFRYFNGRFISVGFDSIKPLGEFFGFPGVRSQMRDHFHKFATGKSNLPLLVNSLPGHGKTSMILSYANAEPELIVVLPDPITLETGWNELISPLAARPDRKFVLFFDDIDPNATNWFTFRTNVGGAFSLPDNIMPVLSANYEFPANILSRGQKISFPLFDELRCCEMVEDFLATFGVRHYHRNLISQIAADYTEEFGQKKFTELSPRSLVRYLSAYKTDPNKRRTIVNLASGPMVTRPDAQLFYEFNIELMRSLYGEEHIKKLLKERLDDLSHT